CFVCEKDMPEGDLLRSEGPLTCSQCPNYVQIEQMSGQGLLKHMGTHILYDAALRGADSPCGLCLNTGGLCEIYLLQRHGGEMVSIDQVKSRCPNLRPFQIKKAEEFTLKQPCTNHPMLCPLCPHGAPAVWKYNLQSHIRVWHPLNNAALYEPHWRPHPDEHRLMEAEWDKLKRRRNRPSKASSSRKLKISDGH
ncbi:hypothetical protein BDN70DRAFT_765889, partial [Pholiota conissans]